ncbi:hypothetical protein PVK06_016289 [Gossypium arboreum]|uniref:Reverse transcriptase n=1 Tax=Gossypium arboreum TaxID=29729 RepID=A0ABR0Q0D3_GOSAR|nr:hypothetical protein PVK06_016289 [Gossypium arboreum]
MSMNMSSLHSKFTDQVKIWNKEVYGHIFTRKKLLTHKLERIKMERDRTNSKFPKQVEIDMKEELKNVLHEEIFWRQKARCDWLVLGDRNTKFFHSRMLRRSKQNRITILKNGLGEWIMDDDRLRLEAVNFYSNLYGEHFWPIRNSPSVAFPCLKDEDFNFLNRQVSDEEIKSALFDMAPLKALGSDGFYALFYQSQWDHVGTSVCTWVKEVFNEYMSSSMLKHIYPVGMSYE